MSSANPIELPNTPAGHTSVSQPETNRIIELHDTPARHMILSQLETNRIENERVLEAMQSIPREYFVPPALQETAYVDEELAVGGGRFLMAPLTLARFLELANIMESCRVLVVGALSGYPAALAARLAAHVTAIEVDPAQLALIPGIMQRLGITNVYPKQVESLAAGYAPSAPYDVIIVHGAVEFIPQALAGQLAMRGRLVAIRNIVRRPGIEGGLGKGVLVERLDSGLQYREHFDASAAVLAGFERGDDFTF